MIGIVDRIAHRERLEFCDTRRIRAIDPCSVLRYGKPRIERVRARL